MEALRRGRSVEQFLGPAGSPDHPGIRYVEVVPAKTHYKIFLHTLEDIGHETFTDPLAALEAAEDATGAARGRWANTGLAQASMSTT